MNKHVFEMLQALALGTPWGCYDRISSVEREDGSGLAWNIIAHKGSATIKLFYRFDP